MRLEQLKAEFDQLLPACVVECARGRWGLFGQNEHEPDAKWLRWPDADRVRKLALEIQSIGREFGQPDSICERFLELCSERGPNVPGEPKLAAALQRSIGEG